VLVSDSSRNVDEGERRVTSVITEIPVTAVACCTPVASAEMARDQSETLASLFKALADPNRVRIVNLLANADEPVCVCEFMPKLGLSQGTVSFHLKKLLSVGLLEREQRGTWAYYSLSRDALSRLAGVFDTGGGKR
jgi:ArsR family transcriptional regulator, arsenate/arsenite/antimonite-responsive transcriptional repressor